MYTKKINLPKAQNQLATDERLGVKISSAFIIAGFVKISLLIKMWLLSPLEFLLYENLDLHFYQSKSNMLRKMT